MQDVRPLCGLLNRGNDCYVNAAIQCLAHTPALLSHFLQPTSHKNGPVTASWVKTLEELCAHPRGSGAVNPCPVREAVAARASQFCGSGPGDPGEFLACVLWELHSEMHAPTSPWNFPPELASGRDAWTNYTSANKTIVSDNFFALMQVDSCCETCQHTSRTFEEFVTLNAHFHSSTRADINSLEAAIEAQFAGGQASLFCERCDNITAGQVVKSLARIPPVLVVHLNHRTDDTHGFRLPLTLDLRRQLSQPDYVLGIQDHGYREPEPYHLFAAIIQEAAQHSNHFWALCQVRFGFHCSV